MLHTGGLTVRRSRLLDVRTLDSAAGLARADIPADAAVAADESDPTGIRPFESYRFAGVPFVLRLAAEPAAAKVSAAVETVLKIGDDQQGLESRIRFDCARPAGLPLPGAAAGRIPARSGRRGRTAARGLPIRCHAARGATGESC